MAVIQTKRRRRLVLMCVMLMPELNKLVTTGLLYYAGRVGRKPCVYDERQSPYDDT